MGSTPLEGVKAEYEAAKRNHEHTKELLAQERRKLASMSTDADMRKRNKSAIESQKRVIEHAKKQVENAKKSLQNRKEALARAKKNLK